jgi:hypothetical protein
MRNEQGDKQRDAGTDDSPTATFYRGASFHEEVIWIAIPPALTRLERLNHRMLDRVIVLGCMLVLRRIAAPYVSTREAESQVDPSIAHLDTFFASL